MNNLSTDTCCLLKLNITEIIKIPKAMLLTAKGNGMVMRRRIKGKRVLFPLLSFIRF